LVLQELDAGYFPRGNPRRITRQGLFITGIAWSPDSKSLVYSGSLSWAANPRLWRAWVDGAQQPERLELAGYNAQQPSSAPAGNRLAFSRIAWNNDIWRYQLGGIPEPFITSSLGDYDPQYSPDGSKIAFSTDRSGGVVEIWIANADGSHPVQFMKGLGHGQGSPGWSPDGRLIVFDSIGQDGLTHIYVIDATGGQPRRITPGTSSDQVPSWSRDGKWIYHSSDRTGRDEIWRSPLGEGAAQQITENGAYAAVESVDGRTVFYNKSGSSPLFARSLSGGAERLLLDYVTGRSFAVFEDGIYYIGRTGADKQYPIQFYQFSTGTSRLLTKVEGPVFQGMGVSPDRKTILFTKIVGSGRDLMMIENFR
jgi:Tol biopolymer transport system component